MGIVSAPKNDQRLILAQASWSQKRPEQPLIAPHSLVQTQHPANRLPMAIRLPILKRIVTSFHARLGSAAGVAILALMAQLVHAQSDAQNAALGQKLKDQFALTTTTADRSDIVTAGTVVVLQTSGLQMCSIDASAPLPNTYKNGKISVSFGDRMVWGMVAAKPGTNIADILQRTFVTGEKFWITGYSPQKDGIFLHLYSDPYDNVRYYAQLKIPFPKGTHPSADDAMKMVSEIITADSPAQNATAATRSMTVPAPVPTQASEPALEPILPPPPPADAPPAAPPTVAIGQTKDQVAAILGQPQRVAKGATKEIDYYPDMKVIFINGKVTDIQ